MAVSKVQGVKTPIGAAKPRYMNGPLDIKSMVGDDSFLFNDGYCLDYRVFRRMKTTEDSGMEHLGFWYVQDR